MEIRTEPTASTLKSWPSFTNCWWGYQEKSIWLNDWYLIEITKPTYKNMHRRGRGSSTFYPPGKFRKLLLKKEILNRKLEDQNSNFSLLVTRELAEFWCGASGTNLTGGRTRPSSTVTASRRMPPELPTRSCITKLSGILTNTIIQGGSTTENFISLGILSNIMDCELLGEKTLRTSTLNFQPASVQLCFSFLVEWKMFKTKNSRNVKVQNI